MSDSDDIKQQIVISAKSGLSRVRIGNQEVQTASLEDQIKAAEYVSQASDQNAFGLRFRKLRGPGCGA